MKKILNTGLILILGIFVLFINAEAHTKPDEISFMDYSGIISDNVKDYVKSKNEILFAQTGAKIIFVTTDSTDSMNAHDYTKNLYTSWNLGNIGRGNSVLVVMSEKTDDYGIIQGKNIKRVLNDSALYDIVSENFEPDFAKKEYDKSVIKLYNSLGEWYENHYTDLNLELDETFSFSSNSGITKDAEKKPDRTLLWIGCGTIIVLLIIFLNLKRKVDFKYRQQERRLKRRKRRADMDKIINS